MSNHALETDVRFPSGEWEGFFLQPRFFSGRVKMSLMLTFRRGRVSGEGRDRVGDFVVRGTYDFDSGEVHFHKRYLQKHDVYYRGFAEPQNKGIWGTWQIKQEDRGGWHIWPLGERQSESLKERYKKGTDQKLRWVEEDTNLVETLPTTPLEPTEVG